MNVRSFDGIHPQIGRNTFIDPSAAVIGKVEIGEDSSVWPHTTIRGDVHSIAIGARTNIQDGSVIHVTQPWPQNSSGHAIVVGSDVTVGHRVVLHGCTIEDLCLIGMGSLVLDGAILRREVLLGAGSLVPPGRELESGFLWLGSPVRKIRSLTEEERKFLRLSAQHYVDLKQRYL